MNRFLITLVLGVCINSVSAAVINFEMVPGVGVPTEGLAISNQYEPSEGVIFSLEGGGYPVIAQVGLPTTAFSRKDTPLPDQDIGSFFLTDGRLYSGLRVQVLIVTYTTPTAGASGVVLDLDFDEQFTIQARASDMSVLETIFIQAGDPNTGDGVATLWSISRDAEDIHSLRFVAERTSAGAFGLGFDNFDARSVVITPIPAAGWLFGTALGLLGWMRRKAA